MEEQETSTRVYELGFILVPTTAETEVQNEVDTLSTTITAVGGVVHSYGIPEFIDLAYQMEKNIASKKWKWNQGYFGWIKFTAAPDALVALKKALDANLAVIRYILIKTTVDNAIIFKKPKVEPKRGTAEEESEDPIADIDTTGDEDDMKEDHEKLPDLNADLGEDAAVEAPVSAPEEKEEL